MARLTEEILVSGAPTTSTAMGDDRNGQDWFWALGKTSTTAAWEGLARGRGPPLRKRHLRVMSGARRSKKKKADAKMKTLRETRQKRKQRFRKTSRRPIHPEGRLEKRSCLKTQGGEREIALVGGRPGKKSQLC